MVRSAICRRTSNERRRQAWEFSHREQPEGTEVHRGDTDRRKHARLLPWRPSAAEVGGRWRRKQAAQVPEAVCLRRQRSPTRA